MNKPIRAFCVSALLMGAMHTKAAVCGADFVYANLTGLAAGQVFTCGGLATVSESHVQGGGSATAFASLSEGVLRGFANSVPVVGAAGGIIGLGSRIQFTAPAAQAGAALVTMTVTGTWGSAVAGGAARVMAQTGEGFGNYPPGGFTGDPSDFGIFDYQTTSFGQVPPHCVNCTYTPDDLFPFSVSATLPFLAGETFVDYVAQLSLSAFWGGFVDATNTARFSITLPEGMGYTSALAFTAAPVTAVPEPSPFLLVTLGLAAVPFARRRRP